VRIAIVSDTHLPRGSRTLPEPCVERLVAADAILHCGDFMAAGVLDWLEELGPPVHAVLGNVDDATLQDRVPERHVAELGGARIGMVHVPGPKAGRLARLRALFPDTAAVVFGHTHMPEHEQADDGFQVFNPGSPTERRRAPARTMGMATVGDDGRVAFELVAVG
jgi:putative phosphoesterase